MEFCEEMAKKKQNPKPPVTAPSDSSGRIQRGRAISTDFTLQFIHRETSEEEKTRQPAGLFAILKQTAFNPPTFFFSPVKSLFLSSTESFAL